MIDSTRPTEPDLVHCDICLSEIPASAAQTAEGDDYIAHFCGIECYKKWQQAVSEADDSSATEE